LRTLFTIADKLFILFVFVVIVSKTKYNRRNYL